NKALKAFTNSKSPEDFIKLKKLRSKTRHLVKIAKTTYWHNFTSNMGTEVNPHLMWNKIRSLQGRRNHNNIHLTLNSSLITDPPTVAQKLGEYFEENSSNKHYNEDFLTNHEHSQKPSASLISHTDTHQPQLNAPITMGELFFALKKCKSKSAGPDNIPYLFIQNFSCNTYQILLNIYNFIWTKNVFPQSWRNSIVIPINKPGKNKFSPEGYRPISLLNTLCKLLEKIVNLRLIWFLEKINYFTPEQCGFRKNKSSYNCLTKINDAIHNSFATNSYLGMISLDVLKAYDTTWKPSIITNLNTVLSYSHMIKFICNFLETRTFQVRVGSTLSKSFSQINGVPQGSTISVTLFLVAINNITKNIEYPVQSTLYADDFNIFCSSKSLATIEAHLQLTVDKLTNWSKHSGFSFSPEKSHCIIFSRKRNHNPISINIGDKLLNNSKTIKILGITFDKKCSWSKHITLLKNAITPRLNIIKILSHSTWGSKT
ncbi:Reverse transcriptase domain-containing protein, partial [Aphis craccivora]